MTTSMTTQTAPRPLSPFTLLDMSRDFRPSGRLGELRTLKFNTFIPLATNCLHQLPAKKPILPGEDVAQTTALNFFSIVSAIPF